MSLTQELEDGKSEMVDVQWRTSDFSSVNDPSGDTGRQDEPYMAGAYEGRLFLRTR
jgi:hypothetical protein